jgi:hypothetical protein
MCQRASGNLVLPLGVAVDTEHGALRLLRRLSFFIPYALPVKRRSHAIVRSSRFDAFVAIVLLGFGPACSDHPHRSVTAERVPAKPSVARRDASSETTAAPHGPPIIEACDKACDGCTTLVGSEGKLRDTSRALLPPEDSAIDAFFLEYLKSPECRADYQHLEPTAVGSQDDVSAVKMAVDGSFTKPNASQTLVLFFAGHCGVLGTHAERYGTTFDLLLQDGHLVATGDRGPQGVELQPIDLDHDGMTELVDLTADYGSGTTFSQAAVWSYRDGSPKTLATFELSLNSCNLQGEHYESTLLARWDQRRNALCFLTKRRDIGCPTAP